MFHISNIKSFFTLIAMLFILTACGSGGSGTPSNTIDNGDTLAAAPSLKITSIEEQQITNNSTTIKWELTEKATGQIEYGIDTSYGNVTIPEESFDYSKHIQRLTDLEPNSIYHYRIIAEDADGNRVISEDRTFKTISDGTVTADSVSEPETGTIIPSSAIEGSTYTTPDGATVISGLQTGTSVSVAQNNSQVLNSALTGGNKNLIIPSGTWYTDDTLTVLHDTTITFKGNLQQINPTTNHKSYALMNITQGNVTLNNPHLSQGGENRTSKPGTHSVLTIYGAYNKGNITINGGVIEGGGSNNFQGGRNNTTFNGTIFRNSREHLVYASGLGGNGTKTDDASGLTFNDCIFEHPGHGHDKFESNFIQLRHYKNVKINHCIARGAPENGHSQYAILASGVQGLTVTNSSFSGYTAGILWKGSSVNKEGYPTHLPSGHVFNNCTFDGNGNHWALVKGGGTDEVVFNHCTINRPRSCNLKVKFTKCTFKPTTKSFIAKSGANLTFDNCTWDFSKASTTTALLKESNAVTIFTGIQTKITPISNQSFDWGSLSIE